NETKRRHPRLRTPLRRHCSSDEGSSDSAEDSGGTRRASEKSVPRTRCRPSETWISNPGMACERRSNFPQWGDRFQRINPPARAPASELGESIDMAARSSWKGFIRLSLVSIPVKAYTATASGGGEIHLNQIHKDCNTRIKYQKTCPIHGEVPSDAIVMGYEFAKGQYVVIDPDELDKLRTE